MSEHIKDLLAQGLVPEWIKTGAPVTAYTLQAVRRESGLVGARYVDEHSGPCPVCGLHTYGSVVCFGCTPKGEQSDE